MEKNKAKIKWNKNEEEGRDLTSAEKNGIERLRKKNPSYADFVAKSLPLLDNSKSFVSKTMDDAKTKIQENKNILNKAKNDAQDSPIVYDEGIANTLIKEGGMLINEISKNKASLEEAIATASETVRSIRFITGAADVPKVNKDKDNKNENEENPTLYQSEEKNSENRDLERVRNKKNLLEQTKEKPEEEAPGKTSKLNRIRGIENLPFTPEEAKERTPAANPAIAVEIKKRKTTSKI